MRQAASSISIDTDEFHKGYVEGLTAEYCRFNISRSVTESDIVEIIRNLCEIAQEGWLSGQLLRHEAGLIAGWISRQAFHVERVK